MMKKLSNVPGLMKYLLPSYKTVYIIISLLLLLSLIIDSFIAKLTRGVELIPVVTILLTVNVIVHIIMFSHEVTRDQGKLLFMIPMGGTELIVGNLLEFLCSQLIILILPLLTNWTATGKITSPLPSVIIPAFFGCLGFYLIISAIIPIICSYVKETGLRILSAFGALIVGRIIYSLISKIILSILPYIYVSISGIYNTEIDIFSWLLKIAALFLLQLCSAYHIEKKLEIC